MAEPATGVDVRTLVAGRTYRVTFDDCCTQGYFTDVFVRYETDVADPRSDDLPDAVVFGRARIEQLWANYEFKEVESD
jgi:hypothetical protein